MGHKENIAEDLQSLMAIKVSHTHTQAHTHIHTHKENIAEDLQSLMAIKV